MIFNRISITYHGLFILKNEFYSFFKTRKLSDWFLSIIWTWNKNNRSRLIKIAEKVLNGDDKIDKEESIALDSSSFPGARNHVKYHIRCVIWNKTGNMECALQIKITDFNFTQGVTFVTWRFNLLHYDEYKILKMYHKCKKNHKLSYFPLN